MQNAPQKRNPRIQFQLRHLVGVCLLGLVATACNQPSGTSTEGVSLLPDPPHLTLQTIDLLFDSAGTHAQNVGELEVVTFQCTVVEGSFCWFGDPPQEQELARELSQSVVEQVGSIAIENANRNLVRIQCARPLNGDPPFCEGDWGWGEGWEALPLN